MKDIAEFFDIYAPGSPGSATKFSYTGTVSAAQQIRAALTDAAGKVISQSPMYISYRVLGSDLVAAAQAHVVFGDANVANATDADYPITNLDGWQSSIILANWTHFKIKGHGVTTGDFYWYFSGKPNS